MKDIIKEALDSLRIKPIPIHAVKRNDITQWNRNGYKPYVFLNSTVEFVEISEKDINSRKYDGQVYPLTEEQYKHTKNYADKVKAIINLKLESINQYKMLLQAVVAHKFMNNEFGEKKREIT